MKRKTVAKRISPKKLSRSRDRQSGATEELAFSAAEFQHYEKNQYWYIGMTLLLTAFFILFLVAGDYLLMAVVLAAAVAIFRLANVKPSNRQIRLDERGLYWGDVFYPMHKLRAFWVARVEDRYNIYLERVGFLPAIRFVVTDAKINPLVTFLSRHLPYHEHRREPLSDRLNRLLRL